MFKLEVKISGRVQGVGFRFYVKELAQKLNLVGWARNENDGSVFIEAYGEKNNLVEFLKWCYIGPVFAKPEKVNYTLNEINQISYTTFEIF